MWISINVSLQHGWLSTMLRAMWVCVCVPDSRRGGAATVSHLTQVTPCRKAKCWGLQHFYLAPRKTHTKRERGRGSHTWLNKSFSWIQQRETWATHLKLQEIKKPECALRKWKDKETGQNSCENLILIARGPQRDVCYSGYMCVCTYCYSHTEKP